MYALNDFINKSDSCNETKPQLINLLKSKWDNIHREPQVFRYKITNIKEKLVDGKYLLQLNPARGTNRRTPEHISNVNQSFDDSKFNFTKVSQKEIMFSINSKGDEHTVIVNVSPITQYHSLLCPSVNKKLPQIVTSDSLTLALEIVFVAQDCDLKIGFNSLCALASVNHLHYHLFIEKHTLPVETSIWKQIKGPLYYTDGYPAPAFCFKVHKQSMETEAVQIFKLIKYFLDKSIAHNILISMASKGNVRVYVWPRKSTAGVKQLMEFNVAVLELSGWFPVYTIEAYEKLTSADLEKELIKWKIDDFENLCKKVELLY